MELQKLPNRRVGSFILEMWHTPVFTLAAQNVGVRSPRNLVPVEVWQLLPSSCS